ncbi:MAG: HlyD family efflux transporter periplasmic adaptor subunit [Anaerolineae bacterium]|nr:HlyD family efflux transporter periplasmic adaptor subunit [Anaerolineae bacterium]
MKVKWMLLGLLVLSVVVSLAGCSGTAAAETDPKEIVPPVLSADKEVVAEAVIEPARWAELSYDTGGEVTEVLVSEGDRVAAGAPLLRLDTEELALSLQSAQQDVVAQKAALEQLVKGSSETLVARAARENAEQIAQAEVGLQIVELQLEKARQEDPATDVAAAQKRVEQLKLQLAQARAQSASPEVTTAQVALERARIALADAQNEYKKALDRPWEGQGVRDGWAREVEQKGLDYRYAQAQLEGAQNEQRAHTISLSVVETQIEEAEDQLTKAEAAQETYDVLLDVLAAEVEASRLDVEALRAWDNPYLDDATDEEIAQAEARLRQVEIAVARLELQIRDAELRAPFAGTVVDVRIDPGDRAEAREVVVVLATLDQFRARTVDLTELDVARVVPGQPATVSVDALPDSEFEGAVQEIGLQAKDYRGDVVYDIIVELSDQEAAKALRWGMTAMIKIAVQ